MTHPRLQDFITWLEVLLGGESDLLMCNSRSGYNYGGYLQSALQNATFSAQEVNSQFKVSFYLRHTHTLSLSLTHSLTRFLVLSFSLSFSLSHTLSKSWMLGQNVRVLHT